MPGSLSAVLVGGAPSGESVLEMLRKTSIASGEQLDLDLDADGGGGGGGGVILGHAQASRETWEMVLSSSTPDDPGLISKPLDVVIMGHEDGYRPAPYLAAGL